MVNPKLSLGLGILFISFSPIFVKLADEPAVTAAFYRILVAWICLLPYCLAKGLFKIEFRDLLITLLCGLIFAADIAVWNISILEISATVSTLLANLAPVWVGLISFFILRKKTGTSFWIGTALAIAGMVLLVGYANVVALKISYGVIMAILSSIFYAIYIATSKGVLQRVNTLTFMFYNMLAAQIFLGALGLGGGYNLVHFPGATWFYFIGTGLICQLAGWLTINHALKWLPPTKVSVTLLGQTVVTGLLAAWLLREKLDLVEITGSFIVLTGIAITFLKSPFSKTFKNLRRPGGSPL